MLCKRLFKGNICEGKWRESQGRREAEKDHGAGMNLGEREREYRKVGWISVVLGEFSKATGASSTKSEECPSAVSPIS